MGIAAHRPAFEPDVKVILSYGSSLLQARLRTRLRDVYLLVMHLSVTIGVEKGCHPDSCVATSDESKAPQIDVFTTEMSCLTIVWATIEGIRLRTVPVE
jgi:hypothetical protein